MEFGLRGFDTICFRVEHASYKPCPPAQGSPNQPIEEPEVVEQIGWYDDEASLFDYVAGSDRESEENDDDSDGVGLGGDDGDGVCLCGDDEDGIGLDGDNGDDGDGVALGGDDRDGLGLGGDDGDGIGLDGDNGDDVFESMFENVVGNDEITKECMDLFEGYESMLDDEFSSDSDTDKSQVKEGVVLDRIKNDKQRQTYQYNVAGCPWRAHASWMVDKTTFMIKTLVDQHECHMVCYNKEAKVKWIASKFDSIVKSNPSINMKVLTDLLLEKLNVFCARHIDANFRGSYCGDNFKRFFWKASRSSNVYDFNAALKDIGEIKLGAKEWLAKIEPHLWSRFAFDKVIGCDHVTNN
ncbi:hypothetical protein Dsin_004730 [Dipteronia sinensis]|uniref:Transposase n=1 Tax=Dipteronia sinensis TaxID=43782 RepID=A0AAE0AVY3_9ROSI|nr:hypothetical protein Dsin_004730 [Dipteronia sinensis]